MFPKEIPVDFTTYLFSFWPGSGHAVHSRSQHQALSLSGKWETRAVFDSDPWLLPSFIAHCFQ